MSLGKVLVTAKSVSGCDAALQMMRNAGCELLIEPPSQSVDEELLMQRTRDVAGLVFAMEPVTDRLLAQAPALQVIARPGVGVDSVDIGAATRRGVLVTIAAGANDASVADFTLGLLLTSARGLLDGARSVQQGRWDRSIGTEVWRKTLAIVGLGRIGRGVARRARGFDMRVLAVSRQRDEAFAAAHGVEFVSLDKALREADFVSLHAPLTAETQNLIDARALASMRRGAYLINTSRGGLVDEQALAAAVQSGHLAGAAVDVLCTQGAHSPSPLIGVPGIIVTPHMASFSQDAMDRVALSVASSVIAALRGERPPGLVNPEAYQGKRTEP